MPPFDIYRQRNYGVIAPNPDLYKVWTPTGSQIGYIPWDQLQGLNKEVHVSYSEGSDSTGTGTSANPYQTIDHAAASSIGGDRILLKTGDTWPDTGLNSIRNLDGPASDRRTVFGYYRGIDNSNERPVLEVDGPVIDTSANPLVNMIIDGIDVFGFEFDPSNPGFNPGAGKVEWRLLAGNTNLVIQDCKNRYAEILFQEWNNQNATDITLLGNIFDKMYVTSSSTGQNPRALLLYLDDMRGYCIVSHNIFDYGGWDESVSGAGANQYNHNLYAQAGSAPNGTLFQDNISIRASSHGVQMRSGGLSDNNFFGQCAVGDSIGYNESPLDPTADSYVTNNVVSEGVRMQKGPNSCQGANLCTTALWGYHLIVNGGRNHESYHNIATQLGVTTWQPNPPYESGDTQAFNVQSGFSQTNNLAYHWESPTQGDGMYPDPNRTLGGYYQKLLTEGKISPVSGNDDFDRMANVLKNKPLGVFPSYDLSARGLNDWVRAGYNLDKYDISQLNYPVSIAA